jgi:hypothetical protein
MSIIDRSGVLHDLGMKLRQVGRMQISRILGSVPTTSGAYKALIDLIERSYFMRAELNAITALLLKKGLVTEAELAKQFEEEFRHYFTQIAQAWPEAEFDAKGITIKDAAALAERSKREGWPP